MFCSIPLAHTLSPRIRCHAYLEEEEEEEGEEEDKHSEDILDW